MTILKILNELAADNSRLAKEAILEREKNNTELMAVVKAAYDPLISFYITKIPEYKSSHKISITEAVDELQYLADRTYTGHAGIEHLASILRDCNPDDAEVIERIIARDLKCGINKSTIEKIWPGLLNTFDVCLAHKDISGIKFPAFAQTKFDGGRVHLYFDGKHATAFSRNGKTVELCGAIDSSAKLLMKAGEVWDGEIVFRKPGTKILLDRKTSNGHFNRCVKGTITPDIAKDITIICWDIVDTSSTIPYEERVKEYISRWDKLSEEQKEESNIWVAEVIEVNNEEEVQEFYEKMIKHGHEGAVIKNKDFKWQGKRIKGQGKLKAEEEADLIVVGWELGTGKNKNKLGNLICETSDHKLRVNVGTGFSDKEREQPPEYFLDKVVTVKYNQLIKSKDDTKPWTLFLPRFVELRLDKNIANSFGELK